MYSKLIIKTNGTHIEQLQQIICGLIVKQHRCINEIRFLSSDDFKETFLEYFDLEDYFINMNFLNGKNYVYNPSENNKLLNHHIENSNDEYLIYEASSEFKLDDMNTIDYIRLKSFVNKEIHKKIFDYMLPQLYFYEDDKINVGLNYTNDNEIDIYEKSKNMNSDIFNIVNLTKNCTENSKFESFDFIDDIIKYIALSKCDMIIGNISILNYEASFRNKIMVHNITNNIVVDNNQMIVPKQVIFQQELLFANNQLLLEYL